ncbi:MAG: ATP-binding protein [Anaerolineales bacterium]
MSALANLQTELLSRELRTCAVIVRTLASVTELPSLLNAVVEEIGEALEPAQTGIVFLWDVSTGLMRPHAAFGYDLEIFKAIRLLDGESLPGKIYEQGEACLFDTPEKIASAMQDLRAQNRALWVRALNAKSLPESVIGAPIIAGEHKLGALYFESFKPSAVFTQQDLPFAQLIADLIALAVERARLHARAESYPAELPAVRLHFEVFEAISHELRMPLTAIKGYATALLLDEVEWSLAKRQEFLQLIEDECDDMEMLMSSLLNSALTDLNHFVLELQPQRLSKIAQEAVAEMKRRTDQHRMLVDFPPDFPLVQVDARWIKQAFLNLLDNAIKYSPQGGLIVIRGEARPADIVINISDQGIGISPEDMIPLFDKYVRAKSPPETQIPGTGLGLPITRRIIEAHGGHIWAQSKIGEGTTLSFSLPRARPAVS